MKILHLSDLHLGKRIYELSMIEEQRHMLEQALALAREADVTVIAGDVYDRQVPSAEAVALLDDFLTRMSAQGSPVVMIAGNHDSAERLAFAGALMGRSGVYLSPVYDGSARCVTFEDDYGPVHIHLLPFVKPVHVRAALDRSAEEIADYTQAIRAAVAAMQVDVRARNVLVAHQFVTGSATSESEEVNVGGLDHVDADVFAPFDYTALGHLHRAQALCGGRVRYAGAPLCYAFSESGQEKGALMVTLREKGDLSVESRPFTPLHAVRRIRGDFAMLTGADAEETLDYVQITLTDEDDIPGAADKLRAIYKNVLQILYDNARTRAQAMDFDTDDVPQEAPLALFEQFYAGQNGQAMTEGQRALLSGMMETIFGEDA